MSLLHTASRLYEEGLSVIPTDAAKAPLDKKWPELHGKNRKKPNGDYEGAKGCGVVLGHWHERGYLVCLDVDCYNKEVSQAVCEFMMDRLGGSYPYRVGEAPKFAVPVLIPDEYHKITSDAFGVSRIEVLALGQQFVAYGEHPKAKGGRYQWYNGEFELARVPVMSMELLWETLAFFSATCLAAGMTLTKPSRFTRQDDASDLDLAIAQQPIDIDTGKITQVLRRLPPSGMDYDEWLTVGQALHHQYQGSNAGYKTWLAWSKHSPKHNPAAMRRKWDSFGDNTGRPVTMKSLIKMAGDTPLVAVKSRGFLETDTQEISETGQHTEWVLESIIERGTIGQIFAQPGTGKSFLALDMAAHIANGETWNGFRTAPGKVVYLAGEGTAGVRRRKAAIHLGKGLATTGIIVGSMPNFGDKAALKGLCDELAAVEGLSLVVIDTLARAIPGLNENDAGDMGNMVEALGAITNAYGCAICVIHHTPKNNAAQGRGSGAIKGAMDFEIRLEAGGNGAVVVSCAKAKDVEPWDDMAFRLVNQPLPGDKFTDNFRNEIQSAVIEWVDAADVERATRLTDNERLLVSAFDVVWEDVAARVMTPDAIVAQFGLESPAQGLMLERVREHWRRTQADADTVTDGTLRARWKRAADGAKLKGCVEVYDHIMVRVN